MPLIIELVKYNKFFVPESLPIKLVKAEADKDKDLKIIQEVGCETIYWLNDDNEWTPLLWLTGQNFHINANPIIDNGSYYILARFAEKLDCCLYLESFGLAFIPKIGYLYDEEDEVYWENIHYTDLQEKIRETDSFSLAFEIIKKEKGYL